MLKSGTTPITCGSAGTPKGGALRVILERNEGNEGSSWRESELTNLSLMNKVCSITISSFPKIV